MDKKTRLRMSDIPEDLIAYATDTMTIEEQAGLSIPERVALIQRRFDIKGLKPYHLNVIYKKNKVSL